MTLSLNEIGLLCVLGSRRLITYRRLPEGELSDVSMARKKMDDQGYTADDLNAFRRTVCGDCAPE